MDTKMCVSAVEPFIALAEAKKMLGVSWRVVLELVRSGELPAYNTSGRVVRRDEVDEATRGLRVLPSDLRAYMSTLLVS